ncbi:MAG: histidinol-phosphatase HisJ family protein [Fibrobacterota bacterium]
MTKIPENFIWETHGVHMGTFNDHVEHGVDEIEEITELAIARNHPSITFVIHAPRLTGVRYRAEVNTDIKFIRGDLAYMNYAETVDRLRSTYGDKIDIRYGVELDWMGSGIGVHWNRAKVLQAGQADFVIGSVHFSHEGIAYDGSPEEAQELLRLRGSEEAYWGGYIEEMIEMVDAFSDMIQVVGHLDLPKLRVPVPAPLKDINHSDHYLARRMRVLLDMIREHNLALDVNLAGHKKGCGIYPGRELLNRANCLGIGIAIGTDTHTVADLGHSYSLGISHAKHCGYNRYISFRRQLPEKRSFEQYYQQLFTPLNRGIELLNQRFSDETSNHVPHFSFGGRYRDLHQFFPEMPSLGGSNSLKFVRDARTLTLSADKPNYSPRRRHGLYSVHNDAPGTLSILMSILASEHINVETANLNTLENGSAAAFLTLSGPENAIDEAIEFTEGTASNYFKEIGLTDISSPIHMRDADLYITEMDGVELPVPLSRNMIVTRHLDKPGVLLILLSALFTEGINILDLQLGKRGTCGYSIMGIDKSSPDLAKLLDSLGDSYYEARLIELSM